MSTTLRTALPFAIACGLLLAGCAGQQQRTASSETVTTEQTAPAPGEHLARHETRETTSTTTTKSNGNASAPTAGMPDEMIGVASCDQYLSTYKVCHRAAHIFSPDQIDARYDMMRSTLLRDSRDPAKRATLDQRCSALAKQLTDALHGKSCNAAPTGG